MFWVYVIQNPKGVRYVCFTGNLTARLYEYNHGRRGNHTHNRGPWLLVYIENFSSKTEAVLRERFLKSGQGREFVKKFLVDNTTRGREIGISVGS